MAKIPQNELEIKQNTTTKAIINLKSIESTITLPAKEVKITSNINLAVECTRTTRSSSSNSASSDTPATHNGSSWDTDREESNITTDSPGSDSHPRIALTNESFKFLQQYLDQIYSQLQNTILNIDIIEETVDHQIKIYIIEAVGIDPDNITSDEIMLFTTEEVKIRSRCIAEEVMMNNQAKRDLCPLELKDHEIRIPEKHHPPMKDLLKRIDQLYFEHKDERTTLDKLGYTTEPSSDPLCSEISEENVMAFLDPESKPKQPKLPPYVADSLNHDFVDDELEIVVYQCFFCLEKRNPSEGHWESNCRAYKQHQTRKRRQMWQEPPAPPAPVMPQPYHGGFQQPPFIPPVIYPFPQPNQMQWQYQMQHAAMMDPFTPPVYQSSSSIPIHVFFYFHQNLM